MKNDGSIFKEIISKVNDGAPCCPGVDISHLMQVVKDFGSLFWKRKPRLYAINANLLFKTAESQHNPSLYSGLVFTLLFLILAYYRYPYHSYCIRVSSE